MMKKSHRLFAIALIIILSILWLASSGCTSPPPTATATTQVEEQTIAEPISAPTDTPLPPTPIATPLTATPPAMVLHISDEPIAWEGDYMGQEPPGLTPEQFSPDFITTDGGDFAGTFSPDGKAFFFTKDEDSTGDYRLWFTRMEDGGWTEPGRAPFACDCFEYEALMTPDGRFLLYGSQRPYQGTDKERIWVVERTDSGWGEPQFFDAPLNDDFAMYVTLSRFGNVYYTGPDGIYIMELVAGNYAPPEKFPPTLNFPEESFPAHPFIAPDESYLIFDAMGELGYGSRDLYVSFRNEDDGSWSEAINLGGAINTERYEMIASVSPDGKYLFYTLDNRIYWVDVAVIEAVRPAFATTTMPTLPDSSGALAVTSEHDGDREIYLVNTDGSGQLQLINNTARDGWAAWSPDGEQLVFMSDRSGRWLLHTMNADGSNQQMLTANPEADYEPAWSPDGKHIAYSSQRGSDSEIYVMTMDSGEGRPLTDNDVYDAWPAWSPDSSQIAFISPRDGDADIYIVDVDGGNQRRLVQNDAAEAGPNWSPDGKNIVFTSDLDGDQEIYVVNVDGSNLRQLTDNEAFDWWPVWSPDGEKIAFISDREGEQVIYWMNSDGSDPVRLAIDFPVGMNASLAWRPESETVALQVPLGNATAIDGTFSPGEWDGALTTELTNGGEMMLMHNDGYLYLGVRSRAMSFGSICLADEDQVSILHASAALGTAVFQPDGDDWRRTQQFDYCCWQAGQSRLNQFLQTEGWVASIGPKGVPEEMEYQIAMPDGALTLAVVYIDD
ncbi:MAG: hypothetical protein ACE5EY_09905, partial [Anaerolineae bacterium]